MSDAVSIVIPSLNEGLSLRNTIESLQQNTKGEYEIIVVDNGSTDGSAEFLGTEHFPCVRLLRTDAPLGVARARNFGAAFAEGDFLIFVDAHCYFKCGWLGPVVDVLRGGDVGLAGPGCRPWENTPNGAVGFGMRLVNAELEVEWLDQQAPEPYEVPIISGMCHGFRWDFFHDIGGYDGGMLNWGYEDLEVCMRTWLLGYKVMIVPNVEITHVFRSEEQPTPYEVRWKHVVYNGLRTAYAHYNSDRVQRVLDEFRRLPSFKPAFRLLSESDIWSRRRTLEVRRVYDDDWLFDKFGIVM